MTTYNIVVFGGDHCGPEVRLVWSGGDPRRISTLYLLGRDVLLTAVGST